jgi:hypothetical protein
MTRNVTLPNGQVVKNVPDDISDEVVADRMIASGKMSIADAYPDIETGADILPLAGEIVGGVGGGIAGGALAGTAVFPGVGTFVGALIGGAAGTFAGSFAGEAAEAALEDRRLDLADAGKKAGKAAALDAVFGLGLGAAGKVIKQIGRPLLDLANPAVVPIDLLDETIELQEKLKKFDTGLLPSGAGVTNAKARAAETYAVSAVTFENQLSKITKGYEEYADNAVKNILAELPKVSRTELGEMIVDLTKQTEKGVQKYVDPLYKTLDLEGGFAISKQELLSEFDKAVAIHSKGRRDYFGNPVIPKDAQAILNFTNKIKDAVQPAELEVISKTFSRLPANSDLAKRLKNTFNFQKGKLLNNKDLVSPDNMILSANKISKGRVGKGGVFQRTASEKDAYNYITGRRAKMSFSEAQQELSYMKGRLRDIQGSTSPDAAALRLWNSAVGNLEEAMEEAAKRQGGDLYESYRYVSDFYSKATSTIHAPYIESLVKNKEIAKAGELLSRVGEITPARELKKLVEFARETKGLLKEQGQTGAARKINISQSKDPSDLLARSYLGGLLKDSSIGSIDKLSSKFKDERFLDTFNAIVPKEQGAQVRRLVTEAGLLAEAFKKGGAGESLGIRGREISAISSPSFLKTVIFGLLPDVVSKEISNKEIAKKLNAMREIRNKIQNGEKISQGAIKTLIENLPTYAVPAGIAVAAPVEQ